MQQLIKSQTSELEKLPSVEQLRDELKGLLIGQIEQFKEFGAKLLRIESARHGTIQALKADANAEFVDRIIRLARDNSREDLFWGKTAKFYAARRLPRHVQDDAVENGVKVFDESGDHRIYPFEDLPDDLAYAIGRDEAQQRAWRVRKKGKESRERFSANRQGMYFTKFSGFMSWTDIERMMRNARKLKN